jgi:ATP-dependent 26S proteasome regulatory subunit
MNAEHRLLVNLEVFRYAATLYLERLHALWTTRGADEAASADIGRVTSAMGAHVLPGASDLQHITDLLNSRPDAGRLATIARRLGLTAGEELAVSAALWAETDPQFAVVLGCLHDDGARRYASPAVLRLLLEPFAIDVPTDLHADHHLVRLGVLGPAATEDPIRLTRTSRMLLNGEGLAPIRFSGPPARLAGTINGLTRLLASDFGGIVVLRGPAGVGRRSAAAAAVIASGRVPIDDGRPMAELRLLSKMGLAVPIVPAGRLNDIQWVPEDGPVVAWAERDERIAHGYVVDLSSPDHNERRSCWRNAMTAAGVQPSTVESAAASLASRFSFTEGDVRAVMARAVNDAVWDGQHLDSVRIWEAARRQPEHALNRMATLVKPIFTLDDLVIGEETRRQLEELISHVSLQHVVLDEWGFRKTMPRGQGVTVLFTGPPGTGKTMAAEVAARALRQDLYRIDVSSVISKYIGETEKNLAVAFDEAERAGAVLFFDEADSFFAKRTDVRDAHDRYANLEVNYLLQRVETFTGLVILATNRQSAMDEAFVRRLRFIVEFETPDRALRTQLWKRSFPDGLVREGLDWETLAESELTGGSIQSAALAAAFLAASDGGAVTESHIDRALQREAAKLGRAWPGLVVGAQP